MFKELETKRLILKNIDYDDAEYIVKEFSNDLINKYLFDAEPITEIAEANDLISFYLEEEPRCQHRWILVNKENNEKIGTCGFHCWNRKTGMAEIGYDLWPEYWQQGYMSEAIKVILDFAKEEMQVKTIFAHIAKDNVASKEIAKKFGFYDTLETYDEIFRNEKYLHHIYRLDL